MAPTGAQDVTMFVIILAQIKNAAGNGMSSDSFPVMPNEFFIFNWQYF